MILPYVLALFFFLTALANPPVEGGRNAPMASFDYIDITQLNLPGQRGCTATRVSPTHVLTAAHCVTEVRGKEIVEILTVGNVLPGFGKIIKVSIHPKFIATKKAKLLAPKDKKLAAKTTLYDIAFIEVEARPSKRVMEYPQIISAKTKLAPRKKMELAGYGMNEAYWDGEKYAYRETKQNLQIADNEWQDCPLNYFGNELSALAEFNKNIKEHLTIKATRVHTISNNTETIANDGLGMVLPGDSGSPSIEKDEAGKFIITGVASNIVAYGDDSGDASFEIVINGKTVIRKDLANFPDNWGLRTRPDESFGEIKAALVQQGLINESGDVKAGVVIKRKYKRVSEGHYADLSFPENQKFIKSVMSK